MSKQIDELLEQQRQLRAQKAQMAKDLKNAVRRRSRLKHKARLLSASDLASVLVLRQEEEVTKEKAAKRRRSSQPGTRADAELDGGRNAEETHEGDASDVGDEQQEPRAPAGPPALT